MGPAHVTALAYRDWLRCNTATDASLEKCLESTGYAHMPDPARPRTTEQMPGSDKIAQEALRNRLTLSSYR